MTRKKLNMEEFCTECTSGRARTEYVATGGRTEWPDTCAKCSFDTPPTGFTPKPAPTPEPVVDHCSPELAEKLRDAGLLEGHVWQLGDAVHQPRYGLTGVLFIERASQLAYTCDLSPGGMVYYAPPDEVLYLPSTAWLLAAVRARLCKGKRWGFDDSDDRSFAWGFKTEISELRGRGETDPDRLASLLLKRAKE